jgi:hypothetical protein
MSLRSCNVVGIFAAEDLDERVDGELQHAWKVANLWRNDITLGQHGSAVSLHHKEAAWMRLAYSDKIAVSLLVAIA